MELHDILKFIESREKDGKPLPDFVVKELLKLVK